MEKQKYLYLALCLLGLSQSTFGEPVIAKGDGEKSIVVGEENIVKGDQSSAFGTNNTVGAASSSVFGANNTVPHYSTIPDITNIVRTGDNSVFGTNNTVEAASSSAFGDRNVIKGGERLYAFGDSNRLEGFHNSAAGINNRVKGSDSASFGIGNDIIKGGYSAAFGITNMIEGEVNYLFGGRSDIKGNENSAFGFTNKVTGDENLASGSWNYITGHNSLAVGNFNQVEAVRSFSVGTDNEIKGPYNSTFGYGNQVMGENSSVIGNMNIVTGKGSGAWGAGADVERSDERYPGYIGEEKNKNEGEASYMIGNKNEIAAGTSDNFILGNSVSIGEGINNSVALGTGSTVSVSNEVSVGSAGKERKITNVAEGTISPTSTDAVNGSQLYEISRKIEGQGLDELKKDLKRDYKKVKNEMRGIASLSAALAGLHPMQYDPYAPSQVMAAVGSYREKQAIAVGLSHYFTSNVMMSAGVALSDEKRTSTMANLGVTWKFGKGGSQASVENPQIMQSEMQRLARENQAFQAKIGSLESKVRELETALQSLLKK